MSFTHTPLKRTRLNRSELFIPGSKPELFPKAVNSKADVSCIDLEDAVAPQDKDQAKKNLIQALNELDFGKKTVSMRINGLDTNFCYRDVVDVMENGGERLDLMMIPKVGVPADVYAIDMLVTQIESRIKRDKKIGFELIVETAMGMANLDSICTGSGRIESLHFGYADYAASVRMRTTNVGGPNPDYAILTHESPEGRLIHWNDLWHNPISQMAILGRKHGLRVIDGPFGDFSDPDGYNAQGKRTAILGCEGKWAIHPNQVELANDLFTPKETTIERARKIVSLMKEAQDHHDGAVTLDGKLIDAASVRQAEQLIDQQELIDSMG